MHDVGTGSGAIALALAAERPDLRVSASDASEAAVEVARANGVQAEHRAGWPDGRHDLVVANLPYVAEHEWEALAPGDQAVRAARGPGLREPTASTPSARWSRRRRRARRWRSSMRPTRPRPCGRCSHDARTRRDLAGHERVTSGRVP